MKTLTNYLRAPLRVFRKILLSEIKIHQKRAIASTILKVSRNFEWFVYKFLSLQNTIVDL